MAILVLKRPLKTEGHQSAGVEIPAGTEIDRTNRERYIYGSLKCRIVVVDGVEHYAMDEAIDEALKD